MGIGRADDAVRNEGGDLLAAEPDVGQNLRALLADARDFAAYAEAHTQVERAYQDSDGWARKALFNIARMGRFSSDRTIREYAKEIWRIEPVLPR